MPATVARLRAAYVEVDLGAVRDNTARLAALGAPGMLCSVVKADGYGHGALPVARAALAGGARWLAVALAEEGADLRAGGIDAPILVLAEVSPAELGVVVDHRLRATVYTSEGIDALAGAVRAAAAPGPVAVHLKVDTGMHRVGADPEAVPALAERVRRRPELRLEGVWTHLACADDPDHPANAEQLARFAGALAVLRAGGVSPPLVHAANSAGLLAHPDARRDLNRAGIAGYGIAPGPRVAPDWLVPAARVAAPVSHVRVVAAGEAVSYGLVRPLERSSVVATVAIGYGDGVPRRLFDTGAEVLVGGQRRPLAGVVTMDQLLVDCGPPGEGPEVARGDEVVLLGRQGSEEVRPEEWARRLGTIPYEVVCALGARLPRRYRGLDRQSPDDAEVR